MMGYTPVYKRNDGTNYIVDYATDERGGMADHSVVNWEGNGFRLPTEGEWMYASRYIDGTNWQPLDLAPGATANTTEAYNEVAWNTANADGRPHNVGEKVPTALGIYDMSGNVNEWLWDWQANWPTGSRVDYRGPETEVVFYTTAGRLARGGHYNSGTWAVGGRHPADVYHPGDRRLYRGFRVARTP
jgi:formylglycine-generating enzyme required for sulfatase activity